MGCMHCCGIIATIGDEISDILLLQQTLSDAPLCQRSPVQMKRAGGDEASVTVVEGMVITAFCWACVIGAQPCGPLWGVAPHVVQLAQPGSNEMTPVVHGPSGDFAMLTETPAPPNPKQVQPEQHAHKH